MPAVLALVLLGLAISEAAAMAFCTEPRVPVCAMMLGDFEQYEFDSCRSDMERFRSSTDSYLECLREEAGDTLKKYNRAVESFNRRARGY